MAIRTIFDVTWKDIIKLWSKYVQKSDKVFFISILEEILIRYELLLPNNDIKLPEGPSKGGSAQDTYDEMFGDGSWKNDFQLYNESLVEWSRENYNAVFMPGLSTQ